MINSIIPYSGEEFFVKETEKLVIEPKKSADLAEIEFNSWNEGIYNLRIEIETADQTFTIIQEYDV